MAKPRVFISSTYYDMRNVRADLERFILEQGYEPVLFERGHIAYGTEERVEEDCYREINTCDILINIIGGKIGTQSRSTQYSISQNELKEAIKLGKQIYIFVERPVLAEYSTFIANKEVAGFKATAVNDLKVYSFLEEIFALSGKNPVQGFEVSENITTFLREQWAGLFQVLLQERARQKEVNLLGRIETTADTLDRLVKFLTEERSQGDQAIKDILLSNHPLFKSLKKQLNIPYRIFFETRDEMEALLVARKTNLIEEKEWDDAEYIEYLCEWWKNTTKILKIKEDLFDEEGRLKIFKPDEWDESAVILEEIEKNNTSGEDLEVPF
ncbi:MAG: DUF4062 domain-containing protein [Candidatus Omnitrophica bacterium]|nr:DUF4062 domain-containing protein [Candidatus Omnitrophota bacterium]MDD5488226.1 DUF4062 domain-containing protein [Candidatus Omnitrophota bacterium]